jgi:hypothetical protein
MAPPSLARRLVKTAWLAVLVATAAAARLRADDGSPPVVERIEFVGNRTDEWILRRRLPFSEGQTLPPDGLDRARRALSDMRLFKQVFVSSAPAEGGGALVTVALDDGWYLIPFPFYASGSGGGRGGMVLAERNIFRRAESLTAAGFSGGGGEHESAAAACEGWSLQVSRSRRRFEERVYSDGGFTSTAGLRRPSDESDPSRAGTVLFEGERKSDEGRIAVSFPLPGLRGTAGWEPARIRQAVPAGGSAATREERVGQAVLGLRAGAEARENFMGDLGNLLGFGLAGLEDRLKPLPHPVGRIGFGATLTRGAAWTGSERPYTYGLATVSASRSWGKRNNLSFTLAGGRGHDLPEARKLATGPQLGMIGQYAREFRGRGALAAGTSFSRPLSTTKRGIWQGMVFVEAARAWDGRGRDKAGAGASVFYRFWRFPLPLGVTVTRSLDDQDTQVSAAVGGRF